MLSCCFHLKYTIIVKVCLRMVLILYHGVKSNFLNRFEEAMNRIEISSSAALLIELSLTFRTDTHSDTFAEFAQRLLNNIKKLSSGYSPVDIIC